MNKRAAECIILAQVASDGGKRIRTLVDSLPKAFSAKAEKAYAAGYAAKDKFIERACLIVARHHDKEIRFFVTEDLQKVAKFLIYFDVKIDGKRWQASFHSFDKRWSKWMKSTVASRGNWDHKDPRETCLKIAERIS